MKPTPICLTGGQIIRAVTFHLLEEEWFIDVPDGLNKWMVRQIDAKKKFRFNSDEWRELCSGTQRLLWLLITAGADPFELVKWTDKPDEARAMHRRFSNIIESWEGLESAIKH